MPIAAASAVPSQQPKPRALPLLMIGEFVGTFIANFLVLVVIQGSAKISSDATTQSLMGQLSPLVAIPPAIGDLIPGHPALAPQTLVGNMTGMLAGNVVQPVSQVGFPAPGLFIAVGIGLAYAVALSVCSHRQLNPTFTVAMALFGALKWQYVIPCIVAQMCGGVFACFIMWTCASTLSQCMVDTVTGAVVCGHLPKTLLTAPLYGVSFPPTDPFTWRPDGQASLGNAEFDIGWLFWNNIVFTTFMIIAIIPVFAGKKSMPQYVQPLVIGLVIIPFTMGTSAFGVQNNAALFLGGLIFCTLSGWPSELWSHANNYWTVVATSPFLGAVLGVLFLKLFGWLMSEDGPLYEKPKVGDAQGAQNNQNGLLDCEAA